MVNDPNQPFELDPFRGKLQLSDLFFPVVFVVWVLYRSPGWRAAFYLSGVPVLIWMAALVVTSVSAEYSHTAWTETIAFLYLSLVLIVGVALASAEERLNFLVRVWLAAVAAVVAVGLIAELTAIFTNAENLFVYRARQMPIFGDRVFRIRSTLVPTSKLLSVLLVLALPSVFWLRAYGSARERAAAPWLMAAIILCEALTFSRALVEFCAVFALLWLLNRERKARIVYVVLIVGAYLVMFVALQTISIWRITDVDWQRTSDRSRSLQDEYYYSTSPDTGVTELRGRVEYVHDNYFLLKRAAWRLFTERPLAGWGSDSFGAILSRAVDAGVLPRNFRPFTSAQSEPFTIAAELGLLGLTSFTAFWALILNRMWRVRSQNIYARFAAAQGIACFGVLLTSLNIDIMRFRFLWIALALGLGAAILGNAPSTPVPFGGRGGENGI
jgi:hypothetical protein